MHRKALLIRTYVTYGSASVIAMMKIVKSLMKLQVKERRWPMKKSTMYCWF